MILQSALACVLILLALLSVQLAALGLMRLYLPAPRVEFPRLPDEALPRVLVQLPVCDEGALAVRVAAAAARLDWPKRQARNPGSRRWTLRKSRSTGQRRKERRAGRRKPLDILHRGERTGFKAGNLAFGLVHCDAPFVAIFDADFVPPPDFLRRTVPALVADPGLAFVQARWGHANREHNWLTLCPRPAARRHFAVEQEARFRAGLPISFNGTAGIWRRDAIDYGGGWTGDTLTEDLDLSMRCALKGWRAG